MKTTVAHFKLFSDTTRLRILMLLSRNELCVCQIMSVLGVSQPLVSRNLSMLASAGLLQERREGKLVFYNLNKHIPEPGATLFRIAKADLKDDPALSIDLEALHDCNEYMNTHAGTCDMKAFISYMKTRNEKRKKRPAPRETSR